MYVWSFVSTYVTSLVAQMVKNLPAIREIWIWPLGGKILWSRKWHPPQYSCLDNPMDRGAWGATVYGDTESWTWVSISFSLSRRFLVVVLICISIIFQDVEAFHVIFKRTMWVKLTSGDWPLDPLHCFEFFFQDLPEDICWRKMIFFFLTSPQPGEDVSISTGFPVAVTKSEGGSISSRSTGGFCFWFW